MFEVKLINESKADESVYSANPSAVGYLLAAAHDGDVGAMRQVLSEYPSLTVNSCDCDKRTPLHLAAAGGRAEAVKFLLDEGAVLSPDRMGMLALHDAVMNNNAVEIRSMLAEADLKCPGGVCYLPPEKAQMLRNADVSEGVVMSLTTEEVETKMTQVFSIISKEEVFAPARLWFEIQYYFTELGLHPKYFMHCTSAQIARHIHCLMAAKKVAESTGSSNIHFEIEDEQSGFFLTTIDDHHVTPTERLLADYLANSSSGESFSVIFIKSENPPVVDGNAPLGVFMVDKTRFETHVGVGDVAEEEDLQLVASPFFLQRKSLDSQKLYQNLVHEIMRTRNAAVKLIKAPDHMVRQKGSHVLQFALYDVERKGKVFFSEFSECLRAHGVIPQRMYIESFANGVVAYHCYLGPEHSPEKLQDLVKTLRYVSHFKHSPKGSALVWELVLKKQITPAQAVFFVTAVKFIFTFFPKETAEYLTLAEFTKANAEMKRKLDDLFLQTMSNAITFERIYDTLVSHYELACLIYEDFKKVAKGECEPFYNTALAGKIDDEVAHRLEAKILKTALQLTAHLRMTNFFKVGTAAAIAMRFDGTLLVDRPRSLFPVVPHGIYMVTGRGFYGFHIRFRDIARGGIRMIRSASRQVYSRNASSLLEENYNLALTQHLKNKDIPEGGSKGTILLDLDDQNLGTNGRDSFNKYIDALLDCMMPQQTGIYSHLPTPEILFFGPDENTAGFMDMGAYRAKARGYPYWKALTTGKSTKLGGVPHDRYGMTTNSVHQYVVELLQLLGVDETQITKVQTGGPDGDLGSNEIIIAKDKTVAVVDGSGVAYDPNGLDREELVHLARLRIPIGNFNKDKLSDDKKAFLYNITDKNIDLPNGEHFKTGVELRNAFPQLEYCAGDLFVPCGGRPATVNMSNIHTMFNYQKEPKFKYIVEGANLFFTDDARRVLEEAGVHLFKDASTNKGGVTSSSLEVFAALCMDPKEHDQLLTIPDSTLPPPEFYQQYVSEILAVIQHNASMEFSAIWKANHETLAADGDGYVLKIDATQLLSKKINSLKEYTMKVFSEKNPENDWLVRAVLRRAIPRLLLVHCGIDKILGRVPEAYILAVCATWIANTFVYKYGLEASEFAFYQFMHSLEENAQGETTPTTMASRKSVASTGLL